VCPGPGQCSAIVFEHCDSEVFQVFLDSLAQAVPADPNKTCCLILDNAFWHKTKRLNWHHFQPKYLPAYSPDLNPIERLWLRLKADFLSDFIAKTPEQLSDRLVEGLRHFLHHLQITAQLCSLTNHL
jgi:transposase